MLKLYFQNNVSPETWLNDTDSCNSDCELPNYNSIHQIRSHNRKGRVSNKYMKISALNSYKIWVLTVRIWNGSLLQIFLMQFETFYLTLCIKYQMVYQDFLKFSKNICTKIKNSNKKYHIHFNLNLLDFEKCR